MRRRVGPRRRWAFRAATWGFAAAPQLREREFLRRHAADALRNHPDAMLREIGDHLRNGRGRPADVLHVTGYPTALGRAAETARLDVQHLIAESGALIRPSIAPTIDATCRS